MEKTRATITFEVDGVTVPEVIYDSHNREKYESAIYMAPGLTDDYTYIKKSKERK